MSEHSRRADNLVIGGGLAGAMAALRLAAQGRQVTLLEKERGPHHKVCGEFLSREAIDYLREAGLDLVALGAQPLKAVRLTAGRWLAEADLPFPALSLSRRVLDEALLARAGQAGCTVQRGALVESLNAAADGWSARIREDEAAGSPQQAGTQASAGAVRVWNARSVFLSSGKHDLRGFDRGHSAQGDLVGFKMHWRLAPEQCCALRGAMELFLFRGGYGGLSPVEDEQANLCLVVRRARLRQLSGWIELLNAIEAETPHLAKRLNGATALWNRPLAVSSIPYGYLAGRPGLWCLGDQAAVIPSFTGDGMSIALHSASLAAEMFLAGQTPEQYHRALRRHLAKNMSISTLLSRLLVSRTGRSMAPFAVSLLPASLRWLASATRIPPGLLVKSAL